MSKGYLIYAYNNNSIDYGSMAICNALLIKKNCRIKTVALVTDSGTISYLKSIAPADRIERAFDHVIIDEVNHRISMDRRFMDTRYTEFTDRYYNLNRPSAFEHSPFDQTILVDSDYLMLDDSMDLAWDNVEDFMCNRKTISLDHAVNQFGFDNRLNTMSIPLYWATAIYFSKTPKASIIFKLMTFIKENYEYYHHLYGFRHNGYYRNDFALSIAIHMANNFMEYGTIKNLPIDHILFSMEQDEIHKFDRGTCIISSEPEQGDFRLHRVVNNVHVMNKRAILRHQEDIIAHALS